MIFNDLAMCEEENDLYCNRMMDDIFTVNLLASDAALLNNAIEPKTYTLQLTPSEIQLKYLDKNDFVILLAKWPYRYIRKYGHRDGKFTFEAGRLCDTGEGLVKFQHSNPIEVVRCMSMKMKSMKKLLNNDLDFSECDLLNAAMCMEAGSRSPLPLSISHQNSSNNTRCHLLHKFLSTTSKSSNDDFIEPLESNVFKSLSLSPSPISVNNTDGNEINDPTTKSAHKISITVNEKLKMRKPDYDEINYFPAKSSYAASNYQTIITITTPPIS